MVASLRGSVSSKVESDTANSTSKDSPDVYETSIARTDSNAAFETDSRLEDFYKPIESYEGYHRYDPSFQWTPAEEKKVIRKIDLRICTCKSTIAERWMARI